MYTVMRLIVLAIIFIIFPLVQVSYASAGASADARDLYYYRLGEKIPLRLSTERIAVRFRDTASAEKRRLLLRSVKVLSAAALSVRPASRAVVRLTLRKGTDAAGCLAAIRELNAGPDVRYAAPLLYPGKQAHPIALTDEFVVQIREGVSPGEIMAMNEEYGAEIVRTNPRDPNRYLMRVKTRSGLESLNAANAYYESGLASWSHPNYIPHRELRGLPNDPLIGEQWHLDNTGQGGGTPGADVDAVAAWDVTTGSSGIIIAVYDDGIDVDHEDLAANIAPGARNYGAGDPTDPRPRTTDENHGTAVAGVAAAVGNNAKGVAGIAYGCSILPLRWDTDTTVQDDADAIAYAAENADVMSNSWGYFFPPEVVITALEAAASSGRNGKGLPIFFASGNDSMSIDDINDIAALSSVIAVGATTNFDNRASYSNYGPSLDVVAPSSGGTLAISTTDRMGASGYNPSGNYTHADDYTGFGGTSSACPLAAGVAALVLSVDPDLTRDELKEILEDTADDLGDPGFDIYYGYGRVNARKAVDAARSSSPPSLFLTVSPRSGSISAPQEIRVNVEPIAGTPFDAWGVVYLPDGSTRSFDLDDPSALRKDCEPLATAVPSLPDGYAGILFSTDSLPAGSEGSYRIVVGLVPAGVSPSGPQDAIPGYVDEEVLTVEEP